MVTVCSDFGAQGNKCDYILILKKEKKIDFCTLIPRDSDVLVKGSTTSSEKGLGVSILGFAGCMISVSTTQLCLCNLMAAIDKTGMNQHFLGLQNHCRW